MRVRCREASSLLKLQFLLQQAERDRDRHRTLVLARFILFEFLLTCSSEHQHVGGNCATRCASSCVVSHYSPAVSQEHQAASNNRNSVATILRKGTVCCTDFSAIAAATYNGQHTTLQFCTARTTDAPTRTCNVVSPQQGADQKASTALLFLIVCNGGPRNGKDLS